MRVEILNWEKFNPRRDVKSPSWFRFSHDIFENPEFFDFSHPEIVAWLYLLCLASRRNSGIVTVNISHLERIGRIKHRDFLSAFQKLEAIGVVSGNVISELIDPLRFQKVEARNKVKTAVRNGALVRPTMCQECSEASNRIDAHHEDYSKPLDVIWLCPKCHGAKHARASGDKLHPAYDTYSHATNERNERDETNNTPRPAVLDFESLYKKYPRKEGKQRGINLCKTQIKSPEDFTALSVAIDRYSEHVKRQAIEPRFIKHFSTFMAQWRDWLEADTGTVLKPAEELPDWKRQAMEEERLKNGA